MMDFIKLQLEFVFQGKLAQLLVKEMQQENVFVLMVIQIMMVFVLLVLQDKYINKVLNLVLFHVQ